MALEIERKFLVTSDAFRESAFKAYTIAQGYLNRDPERTVRVRIRDKEAFLTVKGKNHGTTRMEFEYPVPLADGMEMLGLCIPPVVEKTRYLVDFAGHIWEIDEFQGALKGLVFAEVELQHPDTQLKLPPFIGKEVSGDPMFYNSNLTPSVIEYTRSLL